MASLKDIANEMGVSVSLVSKVLNDRMGTTGVREALKEKIQNKASEMGYRRNYNALALLAKRQNAFAVFLHRHGSQGTAFTEDLLSGIAKGARIGHLRMMLNFFDTQEEFEEKAADLHTGIVDGIVLCGLSHPEILPRLMELQREGLKIVSVYPAAVHPAIPNVSLPDEELSRLATAHLIELGCRRILTFDSHERRTAGYRRAHREAGLAVNDQLVFPMPRLSNPYSLEAARTSIRRVLDEGFDFDGISAQADTQAYACLNELVRRGVSVPGDVPIVGIDNSPICTLAEVPLSSVTQNFALRGERAVQLLAAAMDGASEGSVLTSPELVVRASTRRAGPKEPVNGPSRGENGISVI